MKAKEQAKNLIDKHMSSIIINIKQNINVSVINASKKCALITVDEIIEELGEDFIYALKYWEKVKKEIINFK